MYKTRTDANQKVIVDELRKSGCKVWTHGNGTIDLTVKYPGCEIAFMVEVKKGNQDSAHKKLTRLQKEFFDQFNGSANMFVTTNAKHAIQTMDLFKTLYCSNDTQP